MAEEKKCGDGMILTAPDGSEIDPCLYEEIETHHNCVVHVLRCINCGNIEFTWEHEKEYEQDFTEDAEDDEDANNDFPEPEQ